MPQASEESASALEGQLGCGPLLSIRRVHRVAKSPDEGSAPRHRGKATQHALLEVCARRAAAIPLPKAVRRLLYWGFRPFPDRQPEVPLAVYRVLEAAGVTLECFVLLKRRRGIEGALVVSDGRQQEAIAIAGIHGLALALAGELPVLITESLSEKLYVRGRSGRPLSPRTAMKRLLDG